MILGPALAEVDVADLEGVIIPELEVVWLPELTELVVKSADAVRLTVGAAEDVSFICEELEMVDSKIDGIVDEFSGIVEVVEELDDTGEMLDEASSDEFVYRFNLLPPPQYSVWFPLQSC